MWPASAVQSADSRPLPYSGCVAFSATESITDALDHWSEPG
jgi:hypothetical protein